MSVTTDRSEGRIRVDLDAIVHPETGRSWSCRIRDFNDSGMLLEEAEHASARSLYDSGVDVRRDDEVAVHFSVPTPDGSQTFRLGASVARVMDTTLGLYFPDGIAMRAYRALEEYARTIEGASPRRGADGAADGEETEIPPAVAREIRSGITRALEQTLPKLFDAFFQRTKEELIVLARDAGTTQRQNTLFEAMNQLEEKMDPVVRAATDRIVGQAEGRLDAAELAAARREREAPRKDGGLSLVDNAEFEDWLAVADIVSRAEARYAEELTGLCLRLGMIESAWRAKDALPVGPAVIAHAFDEAMEVIDIERDMRQVVYGYFRDALHAWLRKFYPALDKLLVDSKVFPDVEAIASRNLRKARPRPAPNRNRRPRREEEAPPADEASERAAPRDAPDYYDDEPGGYGGVAGAEAGIPRGSRGVPAGGPPGGGPPAGGPPGRGAAFGRSAPVGGAPGAGTGGVGSPRARGAAITREMPALRREEAGGAPGFATTQTMTAIAAEQSGDLASAALERFQPAASQPMGNMFGAARELLNLRRGLPGPDGLPSEMPWSPEVQTGDDAAHYTREEIVGALDALRRTAADDGRRGPERHGVRRRLSEMLSRSGEEKMLGPHERDALEVVDGLIDTIRADSYVPDAVQDWLDGLELTFGKLATENVEFLDTSSKPLHPALRLVNDLAELGNVADAGDGIDASLQAQVDALIERVNSDYAGDETVFEEALAEIEPLIERQRRSFEGNLQRVVRQSEGSNRLVSARRAVVGAMDERLSGRALPKELVDLLNPGWRNLLVHAHLRHGPDSEVYTRHLEVVDDIVRAVEAGDGKADADEIVARVGAGLQEIAFEPGRRRPLLDGLHAALKGEGSGASVTLQPGGAAEVLGLAGQVPDTAPTPKEDDPRAQLHWDENLGRARELEVGNWVSVDDDVGRTRILSVAWVGEEHAAFTLVNRKGVKVMDLDLKSMVEGMCEDRIEILDEFDMPLMERASQAMLQNMHNQLTYQATHDALTGLVNRKEFETAVSRIVSRAHAEGTDNVVMFMDLDQFKVINNTSGHDAGDELLRAIVPVLRHELRGVRSTLARLGGDEFGVLLERVDLDEGMAFAEKLLTAVRDFRFQWEEEEYSLTGSLGFVRFSDDERDAAMLLQQADAACYAAKDAGRNRIQTYDADDEGMEARRGVMEWVPKVDRVLKEGRIQLTAQEIAPLSDAEGVLPHFEILMRVLGEDGAPLPPIDFITAAETYDRMPAVDRFIVTKALDWMAANLARLKTSVHGFSINLSGRSLNDHGFLDFVVREMQRTRVPTSMVTWEITETAAIGSMEGAQRFMARLKDLGCSFSLDDFGTGLSSYSYLRNLDVDYVKIDGVFVKDLVENPADYAVVKSVNEIAHFMGKKTIAEFVESDAIIDALRDIGVDFGQGWGISKPVPLDDFFD